MTEYSEERMLPEEPKDWSLEWVNLWLKQYEEHVARYNLFARHAKDRCVLDAGCGFGYGTAILSKNHAKMVIGIDNSKKAIRYASDKYSHNDIKYIVADITCIPFPDNTFDTIYAFEAIEHIKDDNTFLTEIIRTLKDGGYAFISTPNKELSGYEDGTAKNQYHFREYGLNEFECLLNNHFSDVKMYGERYSQRYLTGESNLNSLNIVREKIMHLEHQNIAKERDVAKLDEKIKCLENRFNRLHIEMLKKIIPAKLFKFRLNKIENDKSDTDTLDYRNKNDETFADVKSIEPLISIAPLSEEIIINTEDLDKAPYFIGMCKK